MILVLFAANRIVGLGFWSRTASSARGYMGRPLREASYTGQAYR